MNNKMKASPRLSFKQFLNNNGNVANTTNTAQQIEDNKNNNYNNKSAEKFGLNDISGADPEEIFKPVTDQLSAIKDFFTQIIGYIESGIAGAKWLFTDILNPLVWINDATMGLLTGLKLFAIGIVDTIFGLIYRLFNFIVNPIITGFWGGPHTVTSAKCYNMATCSVPYSILFATLVLPPLGVFMELGLKGWINILICAILTLAFYFPGLIYALIILYC